MKTKFTMPTPERCIALGIKYDGLYTRTQLWLMGYASAVAATGCGKLGICFSTRNTLTVEVDYAGAVLKGITDRLTEYGFTVQEIAPTTTSAEACLPVGCLTNDGKLVVSK